MRTVVLVLIFAACACHGRRFHRQRDPQSVEARELASATALATLLGELNNPTAGWQFMAPGHSLAMGSPKVSLHCPCPVVAGQESLPFLRTSGSQRMAESTATAVDMDEAKLALSYFIDDPGATITPTEGGANNIVQYVETSDGKRYVLRIYNNGLDTGRVKYEHSVLEKIDPSTLPYEIPRYVRSLKTGKTMMELPSGTMCCLCQCIPGGLPKTTDPKPLGKATGQLMLALGNVDPEGVDGEACEAYYEIYQAHHSMNREKFYEYLKGPELDGVRTAIDTMVTEFKVLDDFIEEYLEKCLPQHLTHGDLHYDNVLVDDAGEVTGLLDFEFTSMDWRATEIAVCLSKYVSEDDPFPLVERFLEGFAEAGCKLTPDECEALPYMINLRVMSNVVYFVGRAASGEDSIASLTKRADMYADRIVWVRENRQKIVDCIKSKMEVKA